MSKIAPASAEHLPSIERFDPFGGDRGAEITQQRSYVYVAGGAVLGFIVKAGKDLLGRPYIEYMAIKPSARRQGIAHQLIQFFEQLHAGQRVFISTEANNAAMLKLIAKAGYVQSGVISAANLSGQDELYFIKILRRFSRGLRLR